MDKRALISQSPNAYESDDNRKRRKEIELGDVKNGKAQNRRRKIGIGSASYVERNKYSLDSGQGDHHSPSPQPSSPFPLPATRIDGGAYTNPVFVDDYPPSPRPQRAEEKIWTTPIHGPKIERPPTSAPAERRTRDTAEPHRRRADNAQPDRRGKHRLDNNERTRPDSAQTDSTNRVHRTGSIDKRSRDKRTKSREKTRDHGRYGNEVRQNKSRDPSPERSRDKRGGSKYDKNPRNSFRSPSRAFKSPPRDSEPKLKRRQSRSEERPKSRKSSIRSTRSIERTFSRLSKRNRKYDRLKSETDSDYQNGDYRSDTTIPPDYPLTPMRRASIGTRFRLQARRYLNKRIAESTSSKPSDTSLCGTLQSDVTDDSVFLDDSSISYRSDSSKLPIEPIVTIENETVLRSGPIINGPIRIADADDFADDAESIELPAKTKEPPQYFTFDNVSDRTMMNGDVTSPPLSPAGSDFDDDLPDVMTSADTDDMIVMLLSNRSPCIAKLIAFCGIMQMISGFITMISGASGFLSDITVFDFKFDSPIAFWCGALFVFSGVVGIKTSHTKRRSINVFALLVAFSAGCSALFVLVMTSDPAPIYNCKLDRRVLYYFHLFLMNVEILSSAVLCFMCFKSIIEKKSSQPSEVQVLKTLSKYGLKPEHSVPQMAAAKAAAARNSRPGTPMKSPQRTPPKTPNRSGAPSANSSRTDLRNLAIKNDVRINRNNSANGNPRPDMQNISGPESRIPNGHVIQPPPDVDIPARQNRSRDQRSANQGQDVRDSTNQNSPDSTNRRTANGKATAVR